MVGCIRALALALLSSAHPPVSRGKHRLWGALCTGAAGGGGGGRLSRKLRRTVAYALTNSGLSVCFEMAPHSSSLAWKLPWTEEPGRLQSMGLQRVGHD